MISNTKQPMSGAVPVGRPRRQLCTMNKNACEVELLMWDVAVRWDNFKVLSDLTASSVAEMI